MLDKAASKDMIYNLCLSQDDMKELEGCYRETNYFDIHWMPYLRRCMDFVQLFGASGLYEISKVFFQRVNYKLKKVLH